LHKSQSFPITPDGIGDLLAFLLGTELVIDPGNGASPPLSRQGRQ
jgi:hypothetical protein